MRSSRNLMTGLILIWSMSIMVSCQSSKAVSDFQKDEQGVYHAEKSSIPKGAIRLTVRFTGKDSQKGKITYSGEVVEVHQNGGSFGTVKPAKGEKLSISASKDYGFRYGDVVKLDAMTPLEKEGEVLNIVML